MSVKVFSTKVLIEDTIYTSPAGDRTAILRHFIFSEPREGLTVCSAKGAPLFLSYFKTLSIGLAVAASFNQLEISSKCDIKSENSSTLCKNHKRGKGPFDGC